MYCLKIITIGLLCFISTTAFSQLTVSILDETNPGLVLKEMKVAPTAASDAGLYIEENWNKGNLILQSNRRLSNYPLRFNIQTNQLEIKSGDDIKVCGVDQLASFEWYNSRLQQEVKYINAKNYKDNKGLPVRTFLEVLADGHMKAFVKYELSLKKANYVATVDVGSREDKIIKDEKLYIGLNNVLHEISSKKEKNLSLFAGKEEEIKTFVSDNNLKFNKRPDLLKIVTYYNSIQ